MAIDRLIILGKSDATITMILDNLDSQRQYPLIQLINNLSLPIEKPFDHPAFEITIVDSYLPAPADALLLGVFQAEAKQKIVAAFWQPIGQYISLTHRSASISATTRVGQGCLINSHVSIAAQSRIGHFVSINRNASVGHHTVVHDFTTINPGCAIAGNVTIGRGAQIGMGANVLDGVSIGANTIIGAGAVVTRSIPDNVVAYGNPARIVRQRD